MSPPNPPNAPRRSGHGPRHEDVVMFVDDDPRVLDGIRRSLRNQPYRIVTACSGDEALHVLKSRPIDVIVCDEQMPGRRGIEVMAWVAREDPDVIRILLTGMPSVPLAVRAVNECQLHRFITKPCKEMELALAIEDGLAHRRLVRENRELWRVTREQLQRVERARRELDRFARTLVHDLCQPLQSILLHCELAGDARTATAGEDGQHVKSATRSVERMISLIKALGSYAALDAVDVPRHDVDLNEVVRAVEQDLAAAIRETGTTIVADSLPTVVGHAPLLRQLIQNLIHNAIKFRGEKTIVVRVSSEADADETIRLLVTDDGPGLPYEDTDTLFDALKRGANCRGVDGSGLGLATCRKIMELHGGEISTMPGGPGATFVLTFPRHVVKPPALVANPPVEATGMNEASLAARPTPAAGGTAR